MNNIDKELKKMKSRFKKNSIVFNNSFKKKSSLSFSQGIDNKLKVMLGNKNHFGIIKPKQEDVDDVFRHTLKQSPWIGMKEKNHVKAVEGGYKRIALSNEKRDTILPYLLIKIEDDWYDYLYYKPENYATALETKKILESKKFSKEYHVKLGELFDYDEEDINIFLKKLSKE